MESTLFFNEVYEDSLYLPFILCVLLTTTTFKWRLIFNILLEKKNFKIFSSAVLHSLTSFWKEIDKNTLQWCTLNIYYN